MELNHTISGKTATYEGWEVRASQIKQIEYENFVLLICYVTLPKNYHYFYCKFHNSSNQIATLHINRIIYSYILIPAQQAEAQKIIDDIVLYA